MEADEAKFWLGTWFIVGVCFCTLVIGITYGSIKSMILDNDVKNQCIMNKGIVIVAAGGHVLCITR